MNKVYKISILLGLIVLLLGISHFAFAQSQTGKGYFLEVGDYLVMYNNLRINGYLAVENTLTNQAGKLGDLLVGNKMEVLENTPVYFCDNLRDSNNIPLNKDCHNRNIEWLVTGDGTTSRMNIKKESLTQITTEKIMAAETIKLTTSVTSFTNFIGTQNPVRINGCFSNDGTTTDCSGGSNANKLMTQKMYTDDLNFLSICVGGSNDGKICNNDNECPGSTGGVKAYCNFEISIDPANADFGRIDLGPEANLNKQNLCYRVSVPQNATVNPGCGTNSKAVGGTAAMKRTDFPSNPISPLRYPPTQITGYGITEAQICCYLKPIF